jgi:hypothetical protein
MHPTTTGSDLDRKVLAAVERLGRALGAARQLQATRHELSLLGLSVVETLADGRTRRIGDLAAELDVSQPTVSDATTTLARRWPHTASHCLLLGSPLPDRDLRLDRPEHEPVRSTLPPPSEG